MLGLLRRATPPPYIPVTIANFFINKFNSVGKPVQASQLTNLVYISYGYWLALSDGKERLIDERPESWEFGVMFPSLYKCLKERGETLINKSLVGHIDEKLCKDSEEFLSRIYRLYGRYSGFRLMVMSFCDGSPHKQVYLEGRRLVIDDKIITEHFLKKLKH